MNGVTFDNFHSYDDFSLILSSKEIEAPSPKVETVDLPGGDGVIDLTEAFGEVKYRNRKLTFVFTSTANKADLPDVFSEIQNELHGKKANIILDEDSEFYYVGRITINKWKINKNIGQITIECDCEPYKYKLYNTILTNTISNSATLIYKNLRKRVVPTITLTANAQITFGSNTYSMSAGTYSSPEIMFVAGDNALTVTGNTTITVEYQEGGL